MKLKLADKKRQHKIRMQLGMIAFFSIIGTIVLLQFGNKLLSNQLIAYQKDIKNIELATVAANQKEVYFTMVKRGNYYLDIQDWQAAHQSFNKALELFPSGKRANLGLTKSLIYQCKNEKKYCEVAVGYFNQLNQLDVYSEADISNLSSLIQELRMKPSSFTSNNFKKE